MENFWLRLSNWTGRRPVQLILTILAVVAIAVGLGISLTTRDDLSSVQTGLCSSNKSLDDIDNNQRCQELLKHLLDNPTQANIQRLRNILNEGQ